MSRKPKLENKTYNQLIQEGYLILPPGNKLIPASPASPDEAQIFDPLLPKVLDEKSSKPKRGRHRKDKAVEVLLDKIAKQPLVTEISLKDMHPLADFEIKTPVPGKGEQLYMARLGKHEVYKPLLKEAVEDVLIENFRLKRAIGEMLDVYNFVCSLKDHSNRTLILGILKPEGIQLIKEVKEQ